MRVIKNAENLSGKLSRAVRQLDLWRLARNPLLLTVMAVVHSKEGELPDTRVLLYKKVVELLLWRWEATKLGEGDDAPTWRQKLQDANLKDDDVQQALWVLAFQVHGQTQAQITADRDVERDDERTREATADIAEADLLAALRALHPEQSLDWAEALVHLIKLRAGLLVESRPHVYRFPHRTFQEYLAACYLSIQPNFTEQTLTVANQGVFWWEVILLAVGRWAHDFRIIDTPLGFIDELCPETELAADNAARWRKSWLAGKCLLEIGLARVKQRNLGEKLIERVRRQLTWLITHDQLTPRERAEAGSVLSVLGDPRDLEAMVLVPAGEFTMGSHDTDANARDAEKPAQDLYLPTFRISQYPVTNGQYARFVTATNHQPPDHWRGSTPPSELLNHPVVYVSWHDARAYCVWLSKERNGTVRLPTEAEWEKAARGSDAYLYPWGSDFDAQRCNMADTGIDSTSPVGIFARGVSPYGAFDLAGNVIEWTNSQYMGYPYVAEDGREDVEGGKDRVLRGGVFYAHPNHVRCAYREDYDPDNRLNNLGFRVVAPGSGSLDSGTSSR